MKSRAMTVAVPDLSDLWTTEHQRLSYFEYFEDLAADNAVAMGEEFADIIEVRNGRPGAQATITYRVLTLDPTPGASET